MRWKRRLEDRAAASGDQGFEVRQDAGLEHGVEDAPVGTVPSDEEHSWHRVLRSRSQTVGNRSV